MTKRRRVDANQSELVKALRSFGWLVQLTHRQGDGCPDAFILRRGVLRPIEFKDGAQMASRRGLTDDEAKVHADFTAHGCPVVILETLEQVEHLSRDFNSQTPRGPHR